MSDFVYSTGYSDLNESGFTNKPFSYENDCCYSISNGCKNAENFEFVNNNLTYPCYDKQNNCFGGYDMSIARAKICKDGIVMWADSRSSAYKNGNFMHTDNYKKIFYSKVFRVGILSTGLNEFGDLSFTQVCERAEEYAKSYDKDTFIKSINDKISLHTALCGEKTTVAYGMFEKRKVMDEPPVLLPTVKAYEFAYGKTNNVYTNYSVGNSYNSGVTWAVNYLSDFVGYNDSAAFCAEQTKAVIEKMIALDNAVRPDSVIGGDVHFLIIRKDGSYTYK